MERLRRFVKLVAFGLIVTAVIEQLRRDPNERTWEGAVAGIVPYDFRVPTLARARSRWWNTDDDREPRPVRQARTLRLTVACPSGQITGTAVQARRTAPGHPLRPRR